MIYGAQQTIKLIRLCVFPEEGPAGGCSRPSSAPSLFGPPLPSNSLPPESPGHFSVCASVLLCTRAHCSSRPARVLCLFVLNASDTGLITNTVPKQTAEPPSVLFSQQDFGSQPPPPPPNPNLRR